MRVGDKEVKECECMKGEKGMANIADKGHSAGGSVVRELDWKSENTKLGFEKFWRVLGRSQIRHVLFKEFSFHPKKCKKLLKGFQQRKCHD